MGALWKEVTFLVKLQEKAYNVTKNELFVFKYIAKTLHYVFWYLKL